jgi:hypothetical protein
LKISSGWWFGAVFFPYIGNFITPTDFPSIIFQRGRSTTNQKSEKRHSGPFAGSWDPWRFLAVGWNYS